MFRKLFSIPTVSAHCDLPCGVYDPAQARIEAESVKAICVKAAASDDADFRTRAALIKADELLAKIDEIAAIFAETKKA